MSSGNETQIRLIENPLLSTTGNIVVCAYSLEIQVDPLDAYMATNQSEDYRCLWVCPSSDSSMFGLGAVATVESSGVNRFAAASEALASLASLVCFYGPDQAPRPVLLGGFSFAPINKAAPTRDHIVPTEHDVAEAGHSLQRYPREYARNTLEQHDVAGAGRSSQQLTHSRSSSFAIDELGCDGQPNWEGFGDCQLVLPRMTVINKNTSTWILVAKKMEVGEGIESVKSALLQDKLDFIRQLEKQQTRAKHDNAAKHDTSKRNTVSGQAATEHDCPSSAQLAHAQYDYERFSANGSHAAPSLNSASSDITDSDITSSDAACADTAGLCGCRGEYLDLVETAIESIARGACQKVVVARAVKLELNLKNSIVYVLDHLRQNNPKCAIFAFVVGDIVFWGATPERHVTFADSQIYTTAVAGTVARHVALEDDVALENKLRTSPKLLSEHQLVVEDMVDSLTRIGAEVVTVDDLSVLKLARVQHLSTPIKAQISTNHKGGNSGDSDNALDVISVAGKLHPTPAVAGTPTAAALRFLDKNENFTRGWYAAPIGWCELQGSGEMWVAIRSGLSDEKHTWLFSGAGIMADSVPSEELEETDNKLEMLFEAIQVASKRKLSAYSKLDFEYDG